MYLLIKKSPTITHTPSVCRSPRDFFFVCRGITPVQRRVHERNGHVWVQPRDAWAMEGVPGGGRRGVTQTQTAFPGVQPPAAEKGCWLGTAAGIPPTDLHGGMGGGGSGSEEKSTGGLNSHPPALGCEVNGGTVGSTAGDYSPMLPNKGGFLFDLRWDTCTKRGVWVWVCG